MLVVLDLLDSGVSTRLIQTAQQSHADDARLVAEHSPAEVRQVVEHDETDDDGDDVDGTDDQQQTHPSPDGSQMRLVHRVKVL